jgi:hypothetical protein
MKKQTAVEWLYEEFTKTNYLTEDEFYMKFQKAKEMEKQQIIKHSVELAKILFSNPMQTSGKTAQELVDNYFKNTNK